MSAAIERAEREIELIREYRTRLIADVVTGKLDVRGVAFPPQEGTVEWVTMTDEIEEDAVEDETVIEVEQDP